MIEYYYAKMYHVKIWLLNSICQSKKWSVFLTNKYMSIMNVYIIVEIKTLGLFYINQRKYIHIQLKLLLVYFSFYWINKIFEYATKI